MLSVTHDLCVNTEKSHNHLVFSSSLPQTHPSIIQPSSSCSCARRTAHRFLRLKMTNEFPDEKRWNRAEHDVTILASVDFHKAVGRRSSGVGGSSSSTAVRASQELSIQTRIFKIIVIGDSSVGKTCLTLRFTGGTFPDKTEATIGVDFREKAVEIEGETIKVKKK